MENRKLLSFSELLQKKNLWIVRVGFVESANPAYVPYALRIGAEKEINAVRNVSAEYT